MEREKLKKRKKNFEKARETEREYGRGVRHTLYKLFQKILKQMT